MRLRVDPEGRVAAVRVEAEDATLATTVACAARQIKSQAQFAPPEGGRPIVSFDVRFERID